jgi:NAD(P)-dependent dehydrogenase (short-subunit alcohol dehydrogenase family)
MAAHAHSVAIVTGASEQGGGALARRLARRGFAIVAVYLDDQHAAEATVEAVFAAGSTGVTVRADITDPLDVERLFDETSAAFGRVDVVVHSAAVDGAVLHAYAAGRLTWGGALVDVAPAASITPALERELLRRDIAVNDVLAGLGAADVRATRAEDPIAFLDRWRARRRSAPR